MPPPRIVLVSNTEDTRWTLQTDDFRAVCDALGRDVMAAFCRCFVHADRLTSLIGFAHFSGQHYGRDAAAFQRDLETMVWLTVGTLREMATAIRDLRSSLKKQARLDLSLPEWTELTEIERRWEDDAFYRKTRDVMAFHVDRKLTTQGIDALCQEGPVVLVASDGPSQRDTYLRIGHEALFMGSDKDVADMERFLTTVANDQGIGGAVQAAFLSACDGAGITVEPLPPRKS